MVPPKTTLAMSRWMLTGIQVKLFTACQRVPVNLPVSSTPAGEIMKVTQEFETNRIAVPSRFDRTPIATWSPFRGPESQFQP